MQFCKKYPLNFLVVFVVLFFFSFSVSLSPNFPSSLGIKTTILIQVRKYGSFDAVFAAEKAF